SQEGTAGSDEGQQQETRRQTIVALGQGEAEDNGAIKDEVADDIEIAAEIRRGPCPGDRAIQPVGKAVKEDCQQGQLVGALGQKGYRDQADGKATESENVGGKTGSCQLRTEAIERRIDEAAQRRVQHRGPALGSP